MYWYRLCIRTHDACGVIARDRTRVKSGVKTGVDVLVAFLETLDTTFNITIVLRSIYVWVYQKGAV